MAYEPGQNLGIVALVNTIPTSSALEQIQELELGTRPLKEDAILELKEKLRARAELVPAQFLADRLHLSGGYSLHIHLRTARSPTPSRCAGSARRSPC